jgi:hypothetical protein
MAGGAIAFVPSASAPSAAEAPSIVSNIPAGYRDWRLISTAHEEANTIFPGYTATKFASHIRDVDLRAQLEKSGEAFAMSPEAVAAAIAHAIDQPDGVNVGEIVLRSTVQP